MLKKYTLHSSISVLLVLLTVLCGCGTGRQTKSASDTPDYTVSEEDSPSDADALSNMDETSAEVFADYSEDELQFYPYYTQLDENERLVYRQLVSEIELGNNCITPCAEITVDSLEPVIMAVWCDQPQLFWMEAGWSYSYYESDNCVSEIAVVFNELADDLAANQAVFQESAEELLSGLDGLTAAEQEKAVHDRLLEKADYNPYGLYNQTAYSALVRGQTVCSGYARAFQYLMMQLGIPCYLCEGDAYGGSADDMSWQAHAWVKIRLDGEWYNVDPTWDDTLYAKLDVISYMDYNRTDAEFSDTHIPAENSSFLPACTATACSYESLYGIAPEYALLAQLGVTEYAFVSTLEEYYDACIQEITSTGTGEYTLYFILSDEDCMSAISEALDSGAYAEGFLQTSVSNLGLSGYSFSISTTILGLGCGEYYMAQDISLS